MLDALSTPENRRVTLIFLAVCCIAGIAAAIVGVDDNPPGISLAFLSATALVLACVHPWRTARRFGILLVASILAFVIFVILHNLMDVLADKVVAGGVVHIALQSVGVGAFLLAILVCPPAIVVGAVGSIVMLISGRQISRRSGR